tara:strand:- start:120 stop:1112 length:993 start_codon:yes stop_codon:yes gene_type:complete
MPCRINNTSNFDISEIEDLIQDLFSFSQNRLGFDESPVLNLVSDESNVSPLGKTAHYNPNNMHITIYVDGRHPKDIMRSFSHELVHHNQNLKGEFANIVGQGGSNYAQTNPHLRKMEKEAYLKGNMCFRDWEDGYKSSNPNILNERRIYKMSTKKWKNKELNTLLNEKWGFSMDLNKLNEGCGGYKRDDEETIDELKIHDGGLGNTPSKETKAAIQASPFTKKNEKNNEENDNTKNNKTTVMKKEEISEADEPPGVPQQKQSSRYGTSRYKANWISLFKDVMKNPQIAPKVIQGDPAIMDQVIDQMLELMAKDSTAATNAKAKLSEKPKT